MLQHFFSHLKNGFSATAHLSLRFVIIEDRTMKNSIRSASSLRPEGDHLPDYFGALALAEEVKSVALAEASGKTHRREGVGRQAQRIL